MLIAIQKLLKEQRSIKIILFSIMILVIVLILHGNSNGDVSTGEIEAFDKNAIQHENDLKINTCKDGLYYRKKIFDDIRLKISTDKGEPNSYVVVKSMSQQGLSYLLLMNYPDKSKLISYLAIGGFKSKLLSVNEGNKLFSKILTSDYKIAKNFYETNTYHSKCSFIRIVDASEQYDFEVLNSNLKKNVPSINILKNVELLLNDLYLDVELEDSIPKLPPEFIEKDFNEFKAELEKDLFFELKKIRVSTQS